MNTKNDPLILLDSDVVRHFLNGNQIHRLAAIFPNRLIMLDKVKNELCRSKGLISPVINFLTNHNIPVIDFPTDVQIVKEYAFLLKKFGEGESACMAVARFQKQYIASSNLKDIKAYCQANGIVYLTTMDILVEGLNKNIFQEIDCNTFIQEVKNKGSRLPCNTIREYLDMKK